MTILFDHKEKIQEVILASSYFPVELPLQYCHRGRVSPPSSGWIGVVPLRLRYQDINRWPLILFYSFDSSKKDNDEAR